MSRAYIGVGSNLDGPERQVRSALAALEGLPETRMRVRSSLYRSRPVGPPGQPDYINAVAELETTLSPHTLLDRLQFIEAGHGRARTGERWGPRPLDLDLLMYDDVQIHDARLTVPHPEMAKRNFVLGPLLEIAPGVLIPGAGRADALLAGIGIAGLERIEDDA